MQHCFSSRALVLTAGISVALFSLTLAMAAGSKSTRDGVFTKDQAARGKTAYLAECAKCHGESLTGGEGAPGLVGEDFQNGRARPRAIFLRRSARRCRPMIQVTLAAAS